MTQTALPYFSIVTTFLILFGIMILRYFILAGFFYVMVPISNWERKHYQMKRDIKWSLLSTLIFSAVAALSVRLWQHGHTRIYLDTNEYSLLYLPLSYFIYLFSQDTYFYWTHRLLHKKKLFKFHLPHHESKIPTAWTSFAFHPWEALIQALILPLLLMLVPIHSSMLLLVLMTMSLFGITNHLGFEIYPGFIEKRLRIITATHHQFHHLKIGSNYGLYFTFWDRWMGTEHL